MEQKLVTAEDLAALLGVTPAYLRKRARQRAIPAVDVRAGRKPAGSSTRAAWRFDPAAVLAALEGGRV